VMGRLTLWICMVFLLGWKKSSEIGCRHDEA
jgi:hypothetical protein